MGSFRKNNLLGRRPCTRSERVLHAGGAERVIQFTFGTNYETTYFCHQPKSVLTLDAENFSMRISLTRKAIPNINVGLQEIEWVFLATSERWEHACEHLEPQIFLIA